MSKYWTIPFHVVGEDEPRLLPMLNNLDVLLPTPGWFVPSSHIDVDDNEIDYEWAHIVLDEM